MHKNNTAKQIRDAMPALTRRAMLGGVAAAIAAPAPALAAGPMSVDEIGWRIDAEAEKASARSIPLQEQFEASIRDMRAILEQMHPNCTKIHHGLFSRGDGSFYLSVQGYVEYAPFEGDGLYEISRDGHLMPYWLEEYETVSVHGKPILDRNGRPLKHYWGRHYWEGELLDRRYFGQPNIVRKLEWPEGLEKDGV